MVDILARLVFAVFRWLILIDDDRLRIVTVTPERGFSLLKQKKSFIPSFLAQ